MKIPSLQASIHYKRVRYNRVLLYCKNCYQYLHIGKMYTSKAIGLKPHKILPLYGYKNETLE